MTNFKKSNKISELASVGACRPLHDNRGYMYGLTVTPNGRDKLYASRWDIHQNIKKLRRNKFFKEIDMYHFEHKEDGRLHIHGFAWSKYPIKYTPKCKGWQWYFDPIPTRYDEWNWQNYCLKNHSGDINEISRENDMFKD